MRWCFENRSTGRLTFAQFPNVSLAVFVACRLAEWAFDPAGWVRWALTWGGTAALVWWALDEVVRGVNPFRRLLGAVVLLATGWSIASGAGWR